MKEMSMAEVYLTCMLVMSAGVVLIVWYKFHHSSTVSVVCLCILVFVIFRLVRVFKDD